MCDVYVETDDVWAWGDPFRRKLESVTLFLLYTFSHADMYTRLEEEELRSDKGDKWRWWQHGDSRLDAN